MYTRNNDYNLGILFVMKNIKVFDIAFNLFLFAFAWVRSKKNVVRFGRLVDILTGSFMKLVVDQDHQKDPLF